MRFLFLLVVAWVLVAAQAAAAAPEKRVALVIGVAHYENVTPLDNPANDARLIGASLQKLNFQVDTVVDPDYETFKHALRDFGQRLDGASVALFFYAGHGLQVAGRNYLLPVNTALKREQDLRYEAFDLQDVLDEMDAPGRVNLVFLDACRNDPKLSRSLRAHLGSRSAAVGEGLAEIQSQASGTLIAFSTAPGHVASDGNDADSPFSSALARYIATPGLDVRQMLTRVRADVESATNGDQRPWVNESLDADFYFVPQSSQPPPPAPTQEAAASSGLSADILFWASMAGSNNPADFEAYIQRFPQGTFADLARTRLASLASRPAPSASMPSLADLRSLLASSDCTLVNGTIAENSIVLSGLAAPDRLSPIRTTWQALQQVAASTGGLYQFAIQPFERLPAYCAALDAIRPFAIATGVPRHPLVVQIDTKGVPLREDLPFSLAVTMPDFDGWVQADYFSGDDVAHLGLANAGQAPQSAPAVRRLGADGHATFFPGNAGTPGTDLVVAIASRDRLFSQPRPSTESATAYLEALNAALRGRQPATLSAHAIRVVIEH